MRSPARTVVSATCLMISAAFLQSCGGSSQSPQNTAPPLTIATASLQNGTAYSQYSQTIQASGGVAPFSWLVSSGSLPNQLTLSPSTTNSTTITGTPDTPAQAVSFTVEAMDAEGNSAKRAYSLSIIAGPDTLTLSPASLSFSPQLVGSTSPVQIVTVTNTGTGVVNITGVAVTGNNAAEFTQSVSTCGPSLAGGASCTFNVTFTPGQAGPRSAAIAFTDDTGGSPQSLSLNGTGVSSGPNATLSATYLAFVAQTINVTSLPQSLTLNNYGRAALNISAITTSADFAETDNCVPAVASDGSCTIKVTVTPTASGSISGTLSIADNASGSPQTISLTGSGTTNQATLTGYCWYGTAAGTCGVALDLQECPAGAPVQTAVMAGGCWPPQSGLIDPSRGCYKNRITGHYMGNCIATWGTTSASGSMQAEPLR